MASWAVIFWNPTDPAADKTGKKKYLLSIDEDLDFSVVDLIVTPVAILEAKNNSDKKSDD